MESKPQYYKSILFVSEGKTYRGYFEPQFTDRDSHGWFASVEENDITRPNKLFHPDDIESWRYQID